MRIIKVHRIFFIAFFFSLIISIPVIIPFFHTGYFPTHDGEWAVVRLSDMFRELKDVQIPPRYSGYLNFGYGYPLFNFTYPFPYYIGVFIHFLKFGFVDSIKLLFAASVPLSAFFMFLASRELWKNTFSGIVSSFFFVYFPYRVVDLYVRGSIGESTAFVLFPAILFFLLKVVKDPRQNQIYLGITALSYGILILTHNIMAVLFSIFLFVFLIDLSISLPKKNIAKGFIALFLGLLISTFFWLPALMEKQYILLSKIPIAERTLYFISSIDQLVIPKWGYGVPTDGNGFSYQIGIPHIAVLILVSVSLASIFFKKKQNLQPLSAQAAFICLITALLFIAFMFKQTDTIWKTMPFLKEINYPWTVLGPLGFLTSLLAGFLSTRGSFFAYSTVIFSLVAILIILPYAKPNFYVDRGDQYYLTNDATTTSSNELMPLWVKRFPLKRAEDKGKIVNNNGTIKDLFYNSKKISFNATAQNKTKVTINTIYYPGWKAFVNGSESIIDYSNEKGVMGLSVQKGENKIELIFTETPIRLLSDILSLTALFILAFLTVASYYRYTSILAIKKK